MDNPEGIRQNDSAITSSLEQTKRHRHWNEIADTVSGITDALGKPVDRGIFNTVVALTAHGIHTTQSCEGHIDTGIAAPWVEITAPETDESKTLRKRLNELEATIENLERSQRPDEEIEPLYQQIQTLYREVRRPQLEELQKVSCLLAQYYQERKVAYDRLLTIRGNRLESQGAQLQEIIAPEERSQKLFEYQEEMKTFTTFLQKRYLGEG